jgi:hypothetical protein
MKRLLAFLLLLFLPAVADAQQQPQLRTLEAPPRATWQHGATGLRLPATLAGATRDTIRDSTSDELDVSAAYNDPAEGLIVTLYLYRSGLPDVSLWFDRAVTALRLQPHFAIPESASAQVERIAVPGSEGANGLVGAFDTNGQFRGTLVALLPVGRGFLLKMRMTSSREGAAALRARAAAMLREITWPRVEAARPAEIQPCLRPLRLRRARVVRPDMADALLGGMMGAASSGRTPEVARTYCREPGPSQMTGVYRPEASEDSYFIALGDAGIAVSLAPALTMRALEGRPQRGGPVSMTLLERARAAIWPNFDRLPPPEQAIQALRESGPLSTVSLGFGPNANESQQPK